MFEKKYLHSQDTSLGSPFAPNYANLFMGMWEDRHIFINNPSANKILFFERYIENIFIGFKGSEDEVKAFYDYANDTYPTSYFSMEYSRENIHFWIFDYC